MEKIFVLPVLFLAVFLIAIFLVWPATENFFVLKELNLQKQKALQAQQDYFNNLESASDKTVFFGSELAKMNSALPPGLSAASLMEFLQVKSSENGLIIKSLTPPDIVYKKSLPEQAGGAAGAAGDETANPVGDAENAGTVSRIQEAEFILSGSGSVESFENFLRALETSARLFEIETFSLDTGLAGESLPDFHLLLKVYYY